MAEIVDLSIERGYRAGRERAYEPCLGPAQVVLYTGVRYERDVEPPQPSKPKKKRKSRPKNS